MHSLHKNSRIAHALGGKYIHFTALCGSVHRTEVLPFIMNPVNFPIRFLRSLNASANFHTGSRT